MRLIETSTLQLEYFAGKPPPYAILSHTWGSEEVDLFEFINGTAKHKNGQAKIECLCRKAADDGWSYVWVDTCCIDKSSSTELSEAINSMYRWYADAGCCYAYLADVPDYPEYDQWLPAFMASRWFTRGWTLQELLAPKRLTFFNVEWEDIGTRETLKDVVENVSGINDIRGATDACIAQIFSWASRRTTTRKEDRYYSLLGLLGVNMPLLYGEGHYAFERLLLELLARGDDDSIFAWGSRFVEEGENEGLLWNVNASRLTSMLPASLEQYAISHNLRRPVPTPRSSMWSMQNCGLRAALHGYVKDKNEHAGTYDIVVPLNCLDHLGRHPIVTLRTKHSLQHPNGVSGVAQVLNCTRAFNSLGVMNEKRYDSMLFHPLDLMVGRVPYSGRRSTARAFLHGLQLMGYCCKSTGFDQLGIFPRYCVWNERTSPGWRFATKIGDQTYVHPTANEIRQKSYAIDANYNSLPAQEQSVHTQRDHIGSNRARYLDIHAWTGAVNPETLVVPPKTLTLNGEDVTVYFFESSEGEQFALIIQHILDKDCYVDLTSSKEASHSLLGYSRPDPNVVSPKEMVLVSTAFEKYRAGAKRNDRIAIQLRPDLWISASVKGMQLGCTIVLQADTTCPRWYRPPIEGQIEPPETVRESRAWAWRNIVRNVKVDQMTKRSLSTTDDVARQFANMIL